MQYENKWLRVTEIDSNRTISKEEMEKRISIILNMAELNFKRNVYNPDHEVDMDNIDSDFSFDKKDMVYYISNKQGYVPVKKDVTPWTNAETYVHKYDCMNYSHTFNTPIDSDYNYHIAIYPNYVPEDLDKFPLTTAIEAGDWIKFTRYGFSVLFRYGFDNPPEPYDCPRYYVITEYYANERLVQKDNAIFVDIMLSIRDRHNKSIQDHFEEILSTTPKRKAACVIPKLDCRVGPGTSYDIIGSITKSDSVEICDEMEDLEGNNWYYITTPNISNVFVPKRDIILTTYSTMKEENDI